MTRTCVLAAICACLILSAGATGGGSSDREFSALVKRVSELQKETIALSKTIASLEKRVSKLRKNTVASDKESQAADNRSDTRTLLLAEWMDEYHPRKGRGRFHTEEIARRK